MSIRSRECVRIFLGCNEVLVSYLDLVWFGKYKFYVAKANGQTQYLSANDKHKGRTVQIHRLIMNPPAGLEVDHINGNGLDNRRENLRIVTHQVNQCNQPKRSTASSKYYGVYFDITRSRWLSQISYNGVTKSIGRFESQDEAAIAYNNECIKMGLQGIKRMNKI